MHLDNVVWPLTEIYCVLRRNDLRNAISLLSRTAIRDDYSETIIMPFSGS